MSQALKSVRVDSEKITVAFKGRVDPIADALFAIGASINPTTGEWSVDRNGATSLATLLGLDCESLLAGKATFSGLQSCDPPDPELVEEARARWVAKIPPFEHQLIGVAHLLAHPEFLLACKPGTGKSGMVSTRLRIGFDDREFSRVLIVCPKSVTFPEEWPSQLRTWGDLPCSVLGTGSDKQRAATISAIAEKGGILVTNYEMLLQEHQRLERVGFEVIVADEIHRVKDSESKTFRRLRSISKKSTDRWGLSGTPMPNGIMDLYGVFSVLDRHTGSITGSTGKMAFRAKYCVMSGDGRQVIAHQNLPQLHARLRPYTYSVTKEQCLDLPGRTFVTRQCELTPEQKRIYREVKEDAVAQLESLKGSGELTVANVMVQSMRLLQVVGGFVPDDDGTLHPIGSAKMPLLMDVIDEIGRDEPVMIWTAYVAEAEAIVQQLGPTARLHTGQESTKNRQEAVSDFKTGGCQYLVSTASSLREGVTLVRAAYAIYYSRDHNLLNWEQSMDRIYRIGQTRPVTVYSLIARGTIDRRINANLERKQTLQDAMLTGDLSAILGDDE